MVEFDKSGKIEHVYKSMNYYLKTQIFRLYYDEQW